MTKQEWTPGPWNLEYHLFQDGQGGDKFYLLRAGKGTSENPRRDILKLPAWTEENDANARLIAAAPDLLEALKEIVEEWEYGRDTSLTDDVWIQARAAIAKALGE